MNSAQWPKEYTNNDGENPRRLMDWKDIHELEELRDEMKAIRKTLIECHDDDHGLIYLIENLDKQILEARQRNYKIEDEI